jgi:hypothetical protein
MDKIIITMQNYGYFEYYYIFTFIKSSYISNNTTYLLTKYELLKTTKYI